MIRTLTCSLLLAAFLGQGWAQAATEMPAEPTSQSDCAGHMAPGADCDCCPDGAMAAGACASMCSVAFAPATAAPVVSVSRNQFHSKFIQPVRAGPRYLPLNPPPIA